jgi:hypothetical protein
VTTLGLSAFSPEPQSHGHHFINYTREHGLSDVGIRAIAEDHDGNLWIGTESGGAMKITRRGFTSYSEPDGLEHARIAALGEDRDGELFVITNSLKVPSFHIHRFDGRRFDNSLSACVALPKMAVWLSTRTRAAEQLLLGQLQLQPASTPKLQ